MDAGTYLCMTLTNGLSNGTLNVGVSAFLYDISRLCGCMLCRDATEAAHS